MIYITKYVNICELLSKHKVTYNYFQFSIFFVSIHLLTVTIIVMIIVIMIVTRFCRPTGGDVPLFLDLSYTELSNLNVNYSYTVHQTYQVCMCCGLTNTVMLCVYIVRLAPTVCESLRVDFAASDSR